MSKSYQFVFWALVSFVLIVLFGQVEGHYIEAFYFVSFLMPVAIGTSVYFNHILVPKYLLKRRYLKFGLYLSYAVIFSLYLEMVVLTLALIVLANYNYEELNPYTTNLTLLTATIYLIVFIDAFILLVRKFRKSEQQINDLEDEKNRNEQTHIIVKSERKQVPIRLADILYIESLADYIKIITSSDQIITKEKISEISERLPSSFIRTHRSFIINRHFVKRFNREEVVLDHVDIPISRTYKSNVLKVLGE
ncbi:MAG: LytTR family transcriptional regulator [Cyclobacteriaceae bacterium]